VRNNLYIIHLDGSTWGPVNAKNLKEARQLAEAQIRQAYSVNGKPYNEPMLVQVFPVHCS